MTDLVVDADQFKDAVRRLETLVDGFDRPRNLMHSINDQDETLWSSVAGTAALRQDFSLAVRQMQVKIDNIWRELHNLAEALSESGKELHDVDTESHTLLEQLTTRLEEPPQELPGFTPAPFSPFGIVPTLV